MIRDTTILAETEIENAKGQRLNLTTMMRDGVIETVVGNESRTGRTVRWITLDREGLRHLVNGANAAWNAVLLAEAMAKGKDDA